MKFAPSTKTPASIQRRLSLLSWVALSALIALLATACSAQSTVDTQAAPASPTPSPTSAPNRVPTSPASAAQTPIPPEDSVATPSPSATAVTEPSTRPLETRGVPDAPVVWETVAGADQGIIRLSAVTELTDLEELADGTLVGVGFDLAGQYAIFVWEPGESQPRATAPIEGELISGMTTLDDEWIALSIIDDFDAGAAHVEFLRLDALADGPVWSDDGIWSIDGQILDQPGPEFLMAGRRGEPPEFEFAIRSVDDADAFELLQRDGYHGKLTPLADGRVFTDAGLIFDPNEPERDPLTSDIYGVYTISELADGRLATGWTDAWSMYDPAADITSEYPWTGSAYASPTGLSDGRLALNTERGIEIFELDRLGEPVVTLRPPNDAPTSEVLGINLLFTDTHAISADQRLSGSWVWDLNRPDILAVPFDGGTPFRTLADGRVVNNTTTGPIVWNPQEVTAGTDTSPTVQGSLCRAALFDTWLWAASDSGQIAAWDLDAAGTAPPRLFVDTDQEIVGLHMGPDGQPVLVTDSGLIVLAEPGTEDRVSTIAAPFGPVLSSAARENGQIVLGGPYGEVMIVDPAVADGDPIMLFEGTGNSATSVSELPDGRVAALLIADAIMVFDVDGDDRPVRMSLGTVAIEHRSTRDGLLVAQTADGFLAFDPDSPSAPPREIPIGTDSYRELARLGDGRLVTLDDEGILWVAEPNSEPPSFVATGRVDVELGCLSPVGEGRLAIADGRSLLIVEVPTS